ncbi:PREDICTED: alkaline phosphatase, tissue-nonspecific isozyme-like [Priapulus caudatus]|uniref:alkaline phosphatase n=1 Tax=Priapulus caudatus TaxID=37621 RepID=A0ABM1F0N1_PRICU|nr:PREDICTED: alkaline phosphatase, tissue-nonspecific isozyme-like [Priapulus caudatus]
MVRTAIQILNRNPRGYYLFVENNNVDKGHHSGRAFAASTEVTVLEEAVQTATAMTDADDTLLVVTADHSHSMLVAGYPKRGNPMFEKANDMSGVDGMPYTSLLYGAGPGYRGSRPNLTNTDTIDPDYMQEAAVPLTLEPHSGEDVVVYAHGPMAHLFRGNFEQTYVAHAMAYAMCVGSNKQHCDRPVGMCAPANGARTLVPSWCTMVFLCVLVLNNCRLL